MGMGWMGTGWNEMPLSPGCRAKSALAQLQSARVCCHSLPGMDGLEVLKRSILHFNN